MDCVYITFGESLLSNLIRRQVLDIIRGIRTYEKINKYYYLAFVSWWDYIKNRKYYINLYNDLTKIDILCQIIPTPFAIPVFKSNNKLTIKITYNAINSIFMALYMLPFLLYYRFRNNVTLYHTRSYVPTLGALLLKKICKIHVIFDPRSDFPEECALKYNWKPNSYNYRYWKKVEKYALKNSDAVVSISQYFKEHLLKSAPDAKIIVIHNNVNHKMFLRDDNVRKSMRYKYGLHEKIVFCYLGSFQENAWNNPDLYVIFLKKCIQLKIKKIFVLFLIPDHCVPVLVSALERHHVEDKYYLIKSPDYEEVPKYMSIGDVGLYFLPFESPRVGTKVVEYCANEMPILINESVKGAVNIVKNNKVGWIVKNDVFKNDVYHEQEILNIIKDARNNKAFKYNTQTLTREQFSNRIVVDRYKTVYDELL
jgi:glycosyltransferase involved in cell wall biosynthesis